MNRIGLSRRLLRFGRELRRREDGAVLVYVSVALTVFLGFAALVIDGGRYFTLDTEMQQAADAIALAGAAELDGGSDAITRATAAMDNLVQNNETFGNGTDHAIAGSADYTPVFLSSLPSDDTPISDIEDPSGAYYTTDATLARFVLVKLTGSDSRSIDTFFASAINGGPTADAGATAIAGFTQAVCKFTPLFICNPYENTDDSLAYFESQIQQKSVQRQIIALKKSGSGASMAPGNFGFLESGAGPGAAALKDSLARTDPGSCFLQTGVKTQTGSVDSARHALNARFDMYDGSFNSKKNNSNYRPARNVTKGYVVTGNGANAACNASLDTSTPPKAYPFPLDSVIGSNRLGNGDWNNSFSTYWSINHPGASFPPAGTNWTFTGTNLPSRYDVYRWEIDNGNIPNNSASGGENGNMTVSPRCSNSTVNDEPDRRIIYGAVLNCEDLDLHGGSAGTVPALTFIKMFMTQPMTKLPGTGLTDEDDTLYVEMIDIVKPGADDEVVHDIVQLYR